MDENAFWNRFQLSSDVQAAVERLQQIRVLLIGSGGIGSEIALRLAGCQIGHLTIIDGDEVSLSNIPHSSLFLPVDVGCKKVEVVTAFLKTKFPSLSVTPTPTF